jgi:23S rRNA pseudouridine2605 synthase
LEHLTLSFGYYNKIIPTTLKAARPDLSTLKTIMEEKEFEQNDASQQPETGDAQAQQPRRRPRISETRFRDAGSYEPSRPYTPRSDYQRPNDGYNRPQNGYQRDYQRQDRAEGYQPYQRPARPNASYRRYDNNGADGGYQQRPQDGGYQRPQQGYQRPQQGYQRPQQGGYGQPNDGYQQDGGYQRPQQGGYGRQQGGYGRQQQGGYGRQQGGYGRQDQGGYGRQQGGYGRQQQGGYGRQQGGYGRQQQGGGYGRPQQGRGGFGRPQQRRNNGYNPHRPVDYQDIVVDPNEELRLNKYLANAGVCSRREADEYITKGCVQVNGQVVTELGTKVTRKDAILFNDHPVSLERKVYVLLNKPKDTVTTSDDPQGRQTVMDLVRNAAPERIYPVGRLDRNTTGVLLLTNDGDLASKLTHPKYIKKKIYHVWLDKDVTPEDLAKIAAGIELEDGPIHADAIAYANDTDRRCSNASCGVVGSPTNTMIKLGERPWKRRPKKVKVL